MSLAEFLRDRKTANAVIRSLGVLGDVAKRIPNSKHMHIAYYRPRRAREVGLESVCERRS